MAFKHLVKEGEELYKRQEEIIEEGMKAHQEARKLLTELLMFESINLLQKSNLIVGKLGKFFQEIALKIKNPNLKAQIYMHGDYLRNLGGYIGARLDKYKLDKVEVEIATKSVKWNYETWSKCFEYAKGRLHDYKYINESLEEFEKHLQELEREIEKIPSSEETQELMLLLSFSKIEEIIEELRKDYTHVISKYTPYLLRLSSLIDPSYYLVKAYLLEKEADTYILLTDKMKSRYEEIKKKFDFYWQNLKECEELCKN